MGDRALKRRECDSCYRTKYVDQLVRLEIMDSQERYDMVNEVVCEACKDLLVAKWWRFAPTAHRYYHPA